MSKLSFAKFQGSGNDFIFIDDRDGRFPVADHDLIRKMCHRHLGIGADGLILLRLDSAASFLISTGIRPATAFPNQSFASPIAPSAMGFGTRVDLALPRSPESCGEIMKKADSSADFQMRIFNNDGFEAASCGNGLLCLVGFLQDLGVVQEKYKIRTQDRIIVAYLDNGRAAIDMGAPERMRFDLTTEVGTVHCIDTGVPHVVQFVPDVDKVDLPHSGGFLRRLLSANVNFATLEKGRVRVRTFERGVEGETFSCGTGAAAVATVASRLYGLKGPISTHFRGGVLEVWEEEGRIFLSGPAERVFTGFIP